MRSIRNLLDAVNQFRLTRRYDFPALFLFVQTIITLFKFSVLLAVFLAGFLYLDNYLNPPRHQDAQLVKADPPASIDNPVQTVATPTSRPTPVVASAPQAPLPAIAAPLPGANHAATIAPDPEIALLLARLSETGDEALSRESSEPTAREEMRYRARIQWTNVRRAPTATSPIIVSLSTDQKVRIVLQKGDWVQVESDDIDTQNGYVLASLLEPIKPTVQ
jgi:hypothetical protein